MSTDSSADEKRLALVRKYQMPHVDEGAKETDDEFLLRLLDASQARPAEEIKIVDRIWGIFGRPSYESLRGRSIYDLIEEQINLARAAEERASALAAALKLLVDDVADYEAWQRPCHALDIARASLSSVSPPLRHTRDEEQK